MAGDIIRFDPQFAANEVQVLSISADRFEFQGLDDQPSPLSGWLGGTGTAEFGDVQMDLVRNDGDRAILRFQPRSE